MIDAEDSIWMNVVMSTNIRRKVLLIRCMTLSALLAGCQPLSTVNGTEKSTVDQSDATFHDSLQLRNPQAMLSMVYADRFCTYDDQLYNPLNGTTQSRTLSVAFTSFNKKIHVAITGADQKISSTIISNDGKIYDFNSENIFMPSLGAYTPETKAGIDRAEIDRGQNAAPINATNPHVVNEFSTMFPYYEKEIWRMGDTISHVESDDGQIWATYIFAGMAEYKGKEVVVLDLKRKVPSLNQETVLVGYNLIDVRTSLPLYMVFKSGSERHLSQISCNK